MSTFRKNGHFYEKVGKKGEPVCIDDEIPFEVPTNWELCRLENLCSLLNPKIGENGKYPYLNAKFLRNKTDPEIKEKGRFIQTNTKVILVDGENSGEVFLTHEDGYMGSTFRLLDINSQIYDRYILKLIELWRNPLKKSKKGAAIPHLNKDIFNNIFVGIPPFNEQKRIVNQINSLMPLINEYGDYKEKLDKLNSEFPNKLKSSILQEAIQGKLVPQDYNDEPASVLLERIKYEKERLIKEKKIKRNKNKSYIYKNNNHYYEKIGNNEPQCIDDEIPFEIPESWVWTRLGNIISISSGKNLTSKKMDDNFSIPVYGGNGVTGYYNDFNITEKTLIIGRVGANCGNVHISVEKAWVTDNAFITTFPKCCINMQFLRYLLIYLNLRNYSSSTAQPVISGKKIYPILFPLPPFNEQMRIVNKIEEILPFIY